MAVQSLTYAELAELWGISKEAARKKVEGLRLPRRIGNDGKARVQIDLEEVTHTPKSSKPETTSPPPGDLPESNPGDPEETARSPDPEVQLLQERIAELRTDLERERAERERERNERLTERDRADRLTSDLSEQGKRLVELLDDVRELAALRERFAASEVRKQEEQDRHAAELRELQGRLEGEARKAWDELAAFKARPWWKRVAG